MADVTSFLAMMAALSASVQTFVDHVVKKRITWLDAEKKDPAQDNRRQSLIHLISFLVGAGLTWSVGLTPLKYLGVEQAGVITNSVAAGLLVSFGGSFFKELLGAVREFKKAQANSRNTQPS